MYKNIYFFLGHIFSGDFISGLIAATTSLVLAFYLYKKLSNRGDKEDETLRKISFVYDNIKKSEFSSTFKSINKEIMSLKANIKDMRDNIIKINSVTDNLQHNNCNLTEKEISNIDDSLKKLNDKLVDLSYKIEYLEKNLVDKINRIGEHYEID